MMEKPKDRLGVFAVPTSYDKQLLSEAEVVREAMFEEPGNRWYELRHDLFEHLLRIAATYRVLTSDTAEEALVNFVRAVGPSKTWERASSKERMELARKHLAEVSDAELRTAIGEVIAQPGELGLWINTESSLPPDPEPATEDEDVDPEEVARKLDAYVAEQDWKDLRRKRPS